MFLGLYLESGSLKQVNDKITETDQFGLTCVAFEKRGVAFEKRGCCIRCCVNNVRPGRAVKYDALTDTWSAVTRICIIISGCTALKYICAPYCKHTQYVCSTTSIIV